MLKAISRCLMLLPALLACGVDQTLLAQESPSFSRDIQPILSEHCFVCHGADEAEAGLRLDRHDSAVATLDSGTRAIVPGDPQRSELIARVAADESSSRMPPEGEGLDDEQIELLRRWIASGGDYEEHWAWQPIREPAVPDIKYRPWVQNPIDRFVLARLEQQGIAPSPPADRATLIQRLYLDLIGLPPEPEAVDAFVHDTSADAYAALVDRLLASHHFGERWGRHWLDKARYADSDGYEKDNPRPNAWRYRDWVIDAINRDLPFDQFTIEQLAGDLLPETSSPQLLATAFHRQTLTNTEGGTDQEEFRVEATFDRTETTAAVWMGLTMNCARCHAHKYDQISQREYYQLFAFFNDADESETEVTISEAKERQYQIEKRAHDAKLAAARQRLNAAIDKLQPAIAAWTTEIEAQVAADPEPPQFSPAKIVRHTSDSDSDIQVDAEGSLLLRGPAPDTDRLTLVLEFPNQPLTGVRIEAIPDEALPSQGPGRAPNGNFVLTHLRIHSSSEIDFSAGDDIELVRAEADYSQPKFSPAGVLSPDKQTGWAIGGQVGKPHELVAYTAEPIDGGKARFLELVLDGQYGGKHTIGSLRVSTRSGLDVLKTLPDPVAAVIKKPRSERSPEDQRVVVEYVASQHPEAAKLLDDLAQLQQNPPPRPVMKVRIVQPAERSTTVLHRGDFLQPTDEVTAGALEFIQRHHPLMSRQSGAEPDRLDLADWLAHPNHPLTARVTVNQVWTQLFGRGLVATVNDFGVRGKPPTHPELLDWLAWQFPRQMHWSRKALIRTILMSATWQQSSVHRVRLQHDDPENRLLARQNRIRLEAEIIRDMTLAVGGLLDRRLGGPSVYPPLPPGVAELSYANNFKWKLSPGGDAYRRGMYTFFKRTAPHPTLVSFDCPDSNTARLQRETSNTPLQALVTLNNDVYTESAQGLARRVLRIQGGDRQRLTHALRLCMTRLPSDAEVDQFLSLLEQARRYYREHPDDAVKVIDRHAAAATDEVENAAWVATVRMILNLDEFIVRD